MWCNRCLSRKISIKREFNHQTKRWNTVALCKKCGNAWAVDSHRNRSTIKIGCIVKFLLFDMITVCVYEYLTKMEYANKTIASILSLLAGIAPFILPVIIKYIFKKKTKVK